MLWKGERPGYIVGHLRRLLDCDDKGHIQRDQDCNSKYKQQDSHRPLFIFCLFYLNIFFHYTCTSLLFSTFNWNAEIATINIK